jgi:predicted enzyme related to lactoylglutathione lyase
MTLRPSTSRGSCAASSASGHFHYAQLNARGVDRAVPFYEQAFGWEATTTRGPDGSPYTQFSVAGVPFGGAAEMSAMVPPETPSHWMLYFATADVDVAHGRAIAAGCTSIMPPTPAPWARFAIVRDPQGAVFALHQNV